MIYLKTGQMNPLYNLVRIVKKQQKKHLRVLFLLFLVGSWLIFDRRGGLAPFRREVPETRFKFEDLETIFFISS